MTELSNCKTLNCLYCPISNPHTLIADFCTSGVELKALLVMMQAEEKEHLFRHGRDVSFTIRRHWHPTHGDIGTLVAPLASSIDWNNRYVVYSLKHPNVYNLHTTKKLILWSTSYCVFHILYLCISEYIGKNNNLWSQNLLHSSQEPYEL